MKLKKISFRNFKSYSNILTEISFDSKSSLNLIVGENGTGKTSIAECATYLLYGKIENFTSSDIPNRINKNFYGKIEVDCDGHEVIIERGLNPSLFNVQIDGNVVDTAGKLNVQSMLEETYFHIPYTVFHNVLVIEIGEVKSLLDLGSADKRNIIDKICGFTIYNFYGKFVKDDLKQIDLSIGTNNNSIQSINSSIYRYERQIEDIKENITSQEELDSLIKQIKDAEHLKESNEQSLIKLRNAREQLKTSNIENAGEYNNLKSKINDIDRRIKLIDGGKCPMCGSSLDTDDFKKEKENLLKERESCESQMNSIVKLTKDVQSKINIVDKKEQQIRDVNNKSKLIDLKSELKYKQSVKESSISPLENLKIELANELQTLNDEKRKLEEEKQIYDFINEMFADGGIKRYISNKYIPIINTLISDMMEYMNLNYTVTFNNEFDATIIQNGVNVKYHTLSKGEKRRVDFAAVVSFIKFLKLQFGELNLLFLDEIFSNVDVNGVNDMIEILRGLSEDMNLNIFLIHHARLEGLMFDKILKTSKIDGFSKIEYL